MTRQWQSIKKRKDFLALQHTPHRVPAKHMVWQWDIRDEGGWQIGITTTRKLGNAVIRNRCKRRIRALMDRLLAESSDRVRQSSVRLSIIARHDLHQTEAERLLADGRYLMRALRKTIPKQPDNGDASS